MKLKALQSFSQRGAKIIRQGDTFTASEADAEIYIRNGMASLADAETTQSMSLTNAEETTNINVIYLEEDLQEKNVTDLRKIAKNKGVSGYTRMSKSELIFAILASQQTEQIQQVEE